MSTTTYVIEVGGLRWSSELLSGKSGIVNPDNGIYYYAQYDAIEEADKQGLRLPTELEFEQFCKRTTQKWVLSEINGMFVSGMLFKDRRKWYNPFRHCNSIFIPAVGFYDPNDDSFYNVGIYGYLWSSSVCNASYGFFLLIHESYGVYPRYWYYRASGFPVRCVLK